MIDRDEVFDRQIKSPLKLIEQHICSYNGVLAAFELHYIRGNDSSSNSSDYSNTMITEA